VLIKLVNLWAASRLDESHTVGLGHDRQTRGVTYRIALKILKKINLSEPGSQYTPTLDRWRIDGHDNLILCGSTGWTKAGLPGRSYGACADSHCADGAIAAVLSLRWWSVLTAPRGAADDNWQSGA
jgi:hypothetical protein